MVDLKSLLFSTPEKRVTSIYEYIAQRKFDRARTLVRNGLKSDPNYAPYHIALVELEVLGGRMKEARPAIERLFKLGPQHVEELRLRLEDLRSQVSALYECWDALAGCEIRQKNLEGAAEYIKRLAQAEAEKLLQRYRSQCEKLLKGPRENLPPNALNFYKAALLSEHLNRHRDAVEAYGVVADVLPSDVEKIAKHLQALISNNPRLRGLRLSLGDFWRTSGRMKQALEEYRLLLRADASAAPQVLERAKAAAAQSPEDPLPKILLFQVHIAQRNVGDALSALDSYAASGAKERREAVAHLNALREQFSNEPQVFLLLGRLYAEGGDVERGVQALGTARQEGAQSGELVPVLEAVLAREPKNARANELLGEAHFATKRYDLAAKHFRFLARTEGKRFTLLGKAAAMVEVDIANAEGLLLLAELAKGEGQVGRMGVAIRALLRAAPERASEALAIAMPPGGHPQAYLAAVECAVAAGDVRHALQYLSGFFSAYPKEAARGLRAALELAEKEPQTAPQVLELLKRLESSAAVSFAAGEAARAGKLLDEAFAHYKSVLTQAPDKTPVVQEAMEALLQENPEHEALRLDLVDVYFSLKLYDKIRPELDRLMETAPQEMPRIVEKYKALRTHLPEDPALAVGLMRAHLKARTPKAAVKLAAEAIPLAKEDPLAIAEINLYLGDAFRDGKDLDKAAARYGQAAEQARNLLPEVRKRLEAMHTARPDHVATLMWLGRLYATETQWDKGLEAYRAALEADASQGKAILAELESRCAGYAPARLLEARIHVVSGKAARAAELLGGIPASEKAVLEAALPQAAALLKEAPKSAEVHAAHGKILARLERFQEAARSLTQALALNAKAAPAVLGTANEMMRKNLETAAPHRVAMRAHVALGKPKAAVEVLGQLKKAPPEEEREALQKEIKELGATVEHDGALTGALAHETLRLGFREQGFKGLGRALALGGANLDAALEDLDSLLREQPQNASVQLMRASVRAAAERWADAVADVRAAIRISPVLREEALPLLEGLRKQSRRFDALVLEVDALMALGRWKRAFQVLSSENAERFTPEEAAQVFMRHGMVLEQLGERDGAKEAFAKAYKFSENEEEMLAALHDFAAAFVAERLESLQSGGKLKNFSPREIEILRRHATPGLLARLGAGDGKEAARVKSLCYAWQGNVEAAMALDEQSGARGHAAHRAMLAGDWARAAAHLEALARETKTTGVQEALAHAYERLVAESLARKPKVLCGTSSLSRRTQQKGGA
jgi:tetratricopeptide (TPR) repeat protein